MIVKKIQQQGDALFTLWYTGDKDANPVWYVMPGGRWDGNAYSGRIYRTRSSAWIGAQYDASRLEATDVGSMTLRFPGNDELTMSYVLEGQAGEERLVRQPF